MCAQAQRGRAARQASLRRSTRRATGARRSRRRRTARKCAARPQARAAHADPPAVRGAPGSGRAWPTTPAERLPDRTKRPPIRTQRRLLCREHLARRALARCRRRRSDAGIDDQRRARRSRERSGSPWRRRSRTRARRRSCSRSVKPSPSALNVGGQMQFSRRTFPVPCLPHPDHEPTFSFTRGCDITLRSTMLSSDDAQPPSLLSPPKLMLSPLPYTMLRAM